MGDRYQIRNATREDLREVAEIERAVFTDPWPEFAFEPLLGPLGWVAAGSDHVAGYLFARLVEDEGEILNVAVHLEDRRKGLGARLVRLALERFAARQAAAVYLEVRVSNAAARAMYTQMGFQEVGRRRGYYQQPREDAIVLKRSLREQKQGASI